VINDIELKIYRFCDFYRRLYISKSYQFLSTSVLYVDIKYVGTDSDIQQRICIQGLLKREVYIEKETGKDAALLK